MEIPIVKGYGRFKVEDFDQDYFRWPKILVAKMTRNGFNICKELKATEKCFRAQHYDNGDFKDLFHEHVPKSRISEESAFQFLRVMILKNHPFGSSEMLRIFLNSKGKNPARIQLCNSQIEHPEPGVIRKYLCSQGINTWYDEVISPRHFRQ